MPGVVVLGSQWGDEGKGRLVDYLAKKASYVCRFSGGNNAGHTVVYKGKQYLFTILPSGVLSEKKLVIAAGVCFDPEVLISEIDMVEKAGIKVKLLIDPRAHIVMPYHRQRDTANEARRGKTAVGSVGFGVGYCFVDRARRENLRFEDIIIPTLAKKKLDYFFPSKKETLEKIYGVTPLPKEEILKRILKFGKKLRPYLCDVSLELGKALEKGETVLFEGSQGVMLDVNFGTYPYATGSHIISGYVFTSVGLPPQNLKVIGVVKSFSSRADTGAGPLPTEISTARGAGKHILYKGHEFEEFLNIPVRPRRIGWLDLPMLRYAHQLNKFSELALTHADTMMGLKEILVCTHYEIKKKKYLYPQFPGMTENVKPIYKRFPGWQFEVSKIKRYSDLPGELKSYIEFIEKETDTPIRYISLGAERESLIEKR
ncbi:MAG: adenylosuccinate synthase [Patescibacteria group bacterium]